MNLSLRQLWCTLLTLLLLGAGFAMARVSFETQPFDGDSFSDSQRINELCSAPAASSFWCEYTGSELTLITSKGKDLIFNDVGEVVALFVKQAQQRGKDMQGNYKLDSGQNIIPPSAVTPGAAILIDGEYIIPQAETSSWEKTGDTYIGQFTMRLGSSYRAHKVITVHHASNTFEVVVDVEAITPEALPPSEGVEQTITPSETVEANQPQAETQITAAARTDIAPETIDVASTEAASLSLSFPGIGKAQPIIKIGKDASFSENPLQEQVVDDVRYVAMQSAPLRGNAIVMTPSDDPASGSLAGVSLTNQRIALQQSSLEQGMRLNIFAGPNELVRLYQENLSELDGLFKPNIFGRISLGIISMLEILHQGLRSWGLAILALTLLIRLAVWPLMATQMTSMTKMQALQPKLQALQKKYKDNREKLQQETMKVYQEAGVNPLGGCLPMVIQMPILLIMWRVFMNFEFNEGFLWIPDLGLNDPTYLLPIIYIVIMVANSWVMSRKNPQTLGQSLMMNAVFIIFILQFPSGVALYLVGSMFIQLVQQFLIQRNLDKQPPTPTPNSGKGKGKKKPKLEGAKA